MLYSVFYDSHWPIHGTTAIVGARFNDDDGFDSGAAYLFDATTGQQIYKLLPNDGMEGIPKCHQ